MLHFRTSYLLRTMFTQILIGLGILYYGLSPHGFITDHHLPGMLLVGLSVLHGLETVQVALVGLAAIFFYGAINTFRRFRDTTRADFTPEGLRLHGSRKDKVVRWQDVIGVGVAPSVPPIATRRGPYLKIEFRDRRYGRPIKIPVSLQDLRESELEVRRWADEANNRRRIALAYA